MQKKKELKRRGNGAMAYGLVESTECNARRERAELDPLTFVSISGEVVQLNDGLCELP